LSPLSFGPRKRHPHREPRAGATAQVRHGPTRTLSRMTRQGLASLAASVLLACAAGSGAKAQLANEVCLACHGNEAFGVPGADGRMRSLYVAKEKFDQSVHGSRQCVECHRNITAVPHEKVEVQVSCVQCHQDLWNAAQKSNKTEEAAKLGEVVQQIERYMKSIHARPNIQDQSRTNATCYNCHDAHYVYPKGSAIRAEWRLNIPNTCGKCHTPGHRFVRSGSLRSSTASLLAA